MRLDAVKIQYVLQKKNLSIARKEKQKITYFRTIFGSYTPIFSRICFEISKI